MNEQGENSRTIEATMLRRVCVAVVPLASLLGMIVLGVTVFGRDAGDGPNQISLVFATAIAAVLAMAVGNVPWSVLEKGISQAICKAGVPILILFLIGMLSGAWMIGGVVPTLICYGVKIMNPHLFLACACIICAVVSLMTGSSWTTVATIGVALLGIGTALGVPAPWCAGAIISGAYFGDKLSPLSDTTILASSATGTDLFVHIRYMFITTIPSMSLALAVFAVAGFFLVDASPVDTQGFAEGLSRTFHITPWTLLVPVVTGVLIALRLPSLAVMFVSALLGGVSALLLQGDVLLSVVGETVPTVAGYYKALMTVFFASTHVATGAEALDHLVATRGMSGMLSTVWLILCAVSFGGVTLRLSDTAGIHTSEDAVEQIGIGRTVDEIEGAELILAVWNASEALTEHDLELIARLKNASAPVITVLNKTDLPRGLSDGDEAAVAAVSGDVIRVSCETEDGIAELASAVARIFGSSSLICGTTR